MMLMRLAIFSSRRIETSFHAPGLLEKVALVRIFSCLGYPVQIRIVFGLSNKFVLSYLFPFRRIAPVCTKRSATLVKSHSCHEYE